VICGADRLFSFKTLQIMCAAVYFKRLLHCMYVLVFISFS